MLTPAAKPACSRLPAGVSLAGLPCPGPATQPPSRHPWEPLTSVSLQNIRSKGPNLLFKMCFKQRSGLAIEPPCSCWEFDLHVRC